MTGENSGPVDLFGDPWQAPKDRRGRKRHKRSPEVAENISVLKASGLTAEQIAARIGLSEPTMRKYYFRELDEGAVLAQAVLNEAMWKKARAGNVGAARYMQQQFSKGDALGVARPDPAKRPEKPEPRGKKVERQQEAEQVRGIYATPPAPQLIVNNDR